MDNFTEPGYVSKNSPQKQRSKIRISQTGELPEDMLPYLLSGEPDDLSSDFINEL